MANSPWDVGSNIDQADETTNNAVEAAKNLVSGLPYDQNAMAAQTAQSMQPAIGSLGVDGDPESTAAGLLSKAKTAFSKGQISKADAQAALDSYKASQPSFGSVANDIKQSNMTVDSQGVQTPIVNGKSNYGKVTRQYAKGGRIPNGATTIEEGNLNAYSLGGPVLTDKGHDIPSGDTDTGEGNIQGYADGGDVPGEPDGLDQFIAGTQPAATSTSTQQPTAGGMASSGEPQGLNDFIAPEVQQEQYGTPIEQAKAGLEGIAQGVAGPLATAAELGAGVKAEDIRQREEANPFTSMAGKIAGLGGSMALGVGEGRLALAVGEGASNLVKGAGLASKIGAAAADGAVQNMLVSGGDEITKAMRSDPDTSMQSAITNIGLSGLLGGSVSGALGTVSPLWHATFGDKGNQLISDFNGRMAEHMVGADPASTVTKELTDHWNAMNSAADEVYGANGLKAQQISKAMPDFNQSMADQAGALSKNLDDTISTMNSKQTKFPPRLTDKLNDVAMELKGSLAASQQPADIFNAIQDAKQALQGYSKFDKFVTPVDEGHDFVQTAKKLQYDFRSALEDQNVWGAAGKAQQDINKAFAEYLPATKDMQSKFTTKVGGDPVIDPGKVNTYVNQLGKPNAEIRSTVLQNYLKASDIYKGKISDIYKNLGIDNPIQPTSLNATMQTFNKPTAGQKLADMVVEKGLQSAGGKGLGAAIGGMAGGHTNIPGGEFLGAMVGAHVLGPFISNVMPLIAKPLMSSASSAVGLKAAAGAGQAMVRGQSLVSRATSNLFKASKDVIPSSLAPSAAKLAKLDKLIQSTNSDPDHNTDGINNISHYMPQHGAAASNLAGKAVSYLSTLRPPSGRKAPLDNIPTPSSTAMANYNRQLANAEQPLMILNRIKDGTLTSKDLTTVQTIYPNLYKSMAIKIMDEMTSHLAKGNTIPYQTRIGLSKFAVQPLDSTMTPSSIMSAQPQPAMPQPPGEAPGKGKPRKGAGGTALNKLPNQYQTKTQSMESGHQGEE